MLICLQFISKQTFCPARDFGIDFFVGLCYITKNRNNPWGSSERRVCSAQQVNITRSRFAIWLALKRETHETVEYAGAWEK